MKTIALAATLLLLLSACDRQVAPSTAMTASDSMSLERIAGDKNEMAELMRLSHRKGTFDDALALLMQDSTIASAVFDVTAGDDRFAAITAVGTPVAPAGTSPAKASAAKKTTPVKSTRSTSTTTTQPARRGDVLDQAENTARKANERLEQAERVKREAEEAKRRVEVILGK